MTTAAQAVVRRSLPTRAQTIAAAREQGLKVVAALPYHVPRVLLRAHGFHAVEIWAPPSASPEEGGLHFQAYTCPVVVRGAALLLRGLFREVDAVLVPHGCDALQGMGSVLNDFVSDRPPILTLYPPRARRRVDEDYLVAEYGTLAAKLTQISGVTPGPQEWAAAFAAEDAADQALARLLAPGDTVALAALSDRDRYALVRAREWLQPDEYVAAVTEAFAAPPRAGAPARTGPLPIVVAGIVAEPLDLFDVLADAGVYVAADDLATGTRRLLPQGPGDAADAVRTGEDDPWRILARRYLSGPADPTRADTIADRVPRLRELITSTDARGVLFYLPAFWEPEQFNLPALKKALDVPVLVVEHEATGTVDARLITASRPSWRRCHEPSRQTPQQLPQQTGSRRARPVRHRPRPGRPRPLAHRLRPGRPERAARAADPRRARPGLGEAEARQPDEPAAGHRRGHQGAAQRAIPRGTLRQGRPDGRVGHLGRAGRDSDGPRLPAHLPREPRGALRRPAHERAAVPGGGGGGRFGKDLCSYVRTDPGSVTTGKTPVGKLPPPDVLVTCTNICQTVKYWYEVLADHFNVPLVTIDTPFLYGDAQDHQIEYVARQLREELAPAAERAAQTRLTPKKLHDTMAEALSVCRLWCDILNRNQERPAPMTAFDGFLLMGPVVNLRGRPETTRVYRRVLAEIDERVASRTGAIKDERYRVLWDNLPVWYRLNKLSKTLAAQGVNVVASTYTYAWGELADLIDPNDPWTSGPRTYLHPILNRSTGHKLKAIESMVSRFGADGVILHSDRSCKPYSLGQIDQRDMVVAQSGVPALLLEADHNDPRVWADEQNTGVWRHSSRRWPRRAGG